MNKIINVDALNYQYFSTDPILAHGILFLTKGAWNSYMPLINQRTKFNFYSFMTNLMGIHVCERERETVIFGNNVPLINLQF